MDHSIYDLVILGSGSTAFAAALGAAGLGKSAVMIEQRTGGGTCANRGRPPSKNLIEAARIFHEARHPRYRRLILGEVIHEAATALRFHAKVQDFINLLHAYPTMAEALKIAAISRFKEPARPSDCAE